MIDNFKDIIELKMLTMYADDEEDRNYYQKLLDKLIDRPPLETSPVKFESYVSTLRPPQAILDMIKDSKFRVHNLIYEKWK